MIQRRMFEYFPSVLWHCWLGDRQGIRPVKSWVLVCWWWRFDRSFACVTAPVVTATSISRSSSKILEWRQTGTGLPSWCWKMAVKRVLLSLFWGLMAGVSWWLIAHTWHEHWIMAVILPFCLQTNYISSDLKFSNKKVVQMMTAVKKSVLSKMFFLISEKLKSELKVPVMFNQPIFQRYHLWE